MYSQSTQDPIIHRGPCYFLKSIKGMSREWTLTTDFNPLPSNRRLTALEDDGPERGQFCHPWEKTLSCLLQNESCWTSHQSPSGKWVQGGFLWAKRVGPVTMRLCAQSHGSHRTAEHQPQQLCPGDPQLNSHKQITSLLFILVSWPLQWRIKKCVQARYNLQNTVHQKGKGQV